MKYHVLHIETSFAEEWQKDLFDQQMGELGVDTIDGEDYYIPSEVWEANRSAISDQLSAVGFQFSVEACEDKNWNAAWEAEHPMQELPLGIKIIPHCAFGAGHHETTAMMIECLQQSADSFQKSVFRNVLDHGTGTGVLAIFAKRLGAKYVLAIDIDDKSVENAKENAALNNEEIDVRLGTEPKGSFDLILANIHRNVLLDNMPLYATCLTPNGELWMSGFYETDVPVLKEAEEKEGLTLIDVLANGGWQMMKCQKTAHLPNK